MNLSRSSYLVSKLLILFGLSALQTLTFVLIGNTVLEIQGVNIMYWFVLFTISCNANVLGLNISSAFNSAVTVYIIIPLLIIPQMIFSGVIFDFSKLNNAISGRGQVPIIADVMSSRWGYEAIAVEQFKSNKFEKHIFEYEAEESTNNFKVAYWIPKMQELLTTSGAILEREVISDSLREVLLENYQLIKYELRKDSYSRANLDIALGDFDSFNAEDISLIWEHLENASSYYSLLLARANDAKDSVLYSIEKNLPPGTNLTEFKDKHFNDQLESVLTNSSAEERIDIVDGKIIQILDPVFQLPYNDGNILNYRAQFFAPKKHLFGVYFNTYYFNLCAIWFMTLIMYITLYYEVWTKSAKLISRLNTKRSLKK